MGELRIQRLDLATPSHVSTRRPPELGDLQVPPAAALLPRPGTGEDWSAGGSSDWVW